MKANAATGWTAEGNRIGAWSAWALFVLGLLYAPTLITGFAAAGTVKAPLTDPFLAILEVQIILMTVPMVILMGAVHAYARPGAKAYSLAAFGFMALAAGVTAIVHIVELTVARRIEPSAVPFDALYSWEWPSLLYALDVVAWDLFFGLALLLAAPVFAGRGFHAAVRVGLIVAGTLCVAGLVGPALNIIGLRFIGIAGYTVVFPVVCLLMAKAFRRPAAHTGRVVQPPFAEQKLDMADLT